MDVCRLDYDFVIDVYQLYYFSERTFDNKENWDDWIRYTSYMVEDNLESLIDKFDNLDHLMKYIYVKYYDIAKNKFDFQINKFMNDWLDSEYIKNIMFSYDSRIFSIYDIYTKSFIEMIFREWLNHLFEKTFIWIDIEEILLSKDGKDCAIFDARIMEGFYNTIHNL